MTLLLLPLLLWGSSLRSGRGTRSGGKHALNSTHKKHTKDTKNKNKNSAWTTRINKQRQRQRDCQHNKPSTATATTTTSSDHTTQHTRGQQRRTKNKAREKATTDQTNNKVSIATQGAHAGNQKIFHCHAKSTCTSPFLANCLAPVSVLVQRNTICPNFTSLPSPAYFKIDTAPPRPTMRCVPSAPSGILRFSCLSVYFYVLPTADCVPGLSTVCGPTHSFRTAL